MIVTQCRHSGRLTSAGVSHCWDTRSRVYAVALSSRTSATFFQAKLGSALATYRSSAVSVAPRRVVSAANGFEIGSPRVTRTTILQYSEGSVRGMPAPGWGEVMEREYGRTSHSGTRGMHRRG